MLGPNDKNDSPCYQKYITVGYAGSCKHYCPIKVIIDWYGRLYIL